MFKSLTIKYIYYSHEMIYILILVDVLFVRPFSCLAVEYYLCYKCGAIL
jgi:hypothetical protein